MIYVHIQGLNIKVSASLFILLAMLSNYPTAAQFSIGYHTEKGSLHYAVGRFQGALDENNQLLTRVNLSKLTELPDIAVVIKGEVPELLSHLISGTDFDSIQPEGYIYRPVNDGNNLLLLSVDDSGALYGLLELTEQIRMRGSYKIPPQTLVNPSLSYRIVKFNLPWSPYRESEATAMHMQVCRDLDFWERFLDMMAENRFNVLSLWNKHPFPYMIKAANFPDATPFSDPEMESWQQFWEKLFKMAKARGIQTFIVNWNIVVSPEFAAAYGAQEYNDLSEQVKRYTRESVTQVINEYEDLTGLGVTLADWMGTFDEKMTPQQREDWIEQTFVAGMKAADRPVKFIHRSVLAGDPQAMRRLIDIADLAEPALVEIKFNWSHGHSTPTLAITHDYHSGELDQRFWTPTPVNYKIQWMVRNEDFFILRWGQPDFVREHIKINKKDYVNGYFVGSEGYIPALDYSSKPLPEKTWQYAFEKQWLFYKVWGRLLYQQDTPDALFASAFDLRYGQGVGVTLLEAFKLASNMPLRLASFHRSTWDYTLYAEGFIEAEPSSPNVPFDRSSPFISIDEFVDHETLDPLMLSIPEYVTNLVGKQEVFSNRITPLALADSSEHDSRRALEIADDLRSQLPDFSGALISELQDVTAWSYLGLYFADKIRAGVALETYRVTGNALKKQEAIRLLEKCLAHWDQLVAVTEGRYLPTPHVSTEHYGKEYREFSWKLLRPQVLRDIEIARKAQVRK